MGRLAKEEEGENDGTYNNNIRQSMESSHGQIR